MLHPGAKITIYNDKKVEIGQGTFLDQTLIPELKVTAYECEEHTILAKGPHYLEVNGKKMLIVPEF